MEASKSVQASLEGSRPFLGDREPSRAVEAHLGQSRAFEHSPGASAPISIVPDVSRPCIHGRPPCGAFGDASDSASSRNALDAALSNDALGAVLFGYALIAALSSNASNMRLTRVDASFSIRPPLCAAHYQASLAIRPGGGDRRIGPLGGCGLHFPYLRLGILRR